MHFPDTQKALLTHPGLGLRTSLTPSLRTYSPFLLTVKGSLGPSLSAPRLLAHGAAVTALPWAPRSLGFLQRSASSVPLG